MGNQKVLAPVIEDVATYDIWKKYDMNQGFFEMDRTWLKMSYNQGVREGKAFLVVVYDTSDIVHDEEAEPTFGSKFLSNVGEIDDLLARTAENELIFVHSIFDLTLPLEQQVIPLED